MRDLVKWVVAIGCSFLVVLTVRAAEPSSPAPAATVAASPPPKPCEMPEGKQFDFWIGQWDLTWPEGQVGSPPGQPGKGTIEVKRILGDCIVQENFSDSATNYRGMSVSTYVPLLKLWRQTWVDSNGNYLVFTGQFKDGVMEWRSPEHKMADGTKILSRMVFKNITKNSLDWDWQASRDGGQTWKDKWNIHYTRRK